MMATGEKPMSADYGVQSGGGRRGGGGGGRSGGGKKWSWGGDYNEKHLFVLEKSFF